jgi:two-component system response regulator AtoC
MRREKLLVVDDDPAIQTYLRDFLGSRGYAVTCLDSGRRVMEVLNSPDRPAAVLLDLVLPQDDGLDILAAIRSSSLAVPVIVLSGLGETRTIVRAMRMGASDYLVKPFEDDELEMSIRRALGVRLPKAAAPANSTAAQSPQTEDYDTLFGTHSSDPRIARIKEIAEKVADTDAPVLILGETGVGKEVLARYIHSRSLRAQEPFLKVNCAAVPSELLESELFGYERGAFTGAMKDKPGKFELAGHGTLLLDEIGEMSPLLQAKLLQVLQDNECFRLGATKPTFVHARILACTNKRLEDSVAKGEFRQDLFFRLNVIRLELPPLRVRPGDIQDLCNYFLNKYAQRYHREPPVIPAELMNAFLRYSWPGNIRQLENIVRRFVILPEPELALADLARTGSSRPESEAPATTSLREQSAQAAEQAERELVLRTLDEVNWNRKEAAKRLNVCYKSLLNKLHRWQIPGRVHSSSGSAASRTATAP